MKKAFLVLALVLGSQAALADHVYDKWSFLCYDKSGNEVGASWAVHENTERVFHWAHLFTLEQMENRSHNRGDKGPLVIGEATTPNNKDLIVVDSMTQQSVTVYNCKQLTFKDMLSHTAWYLFLGDYQAR